MSTPPTLGAVRSAIHEALMLAQETDGALFGNWWIDHQDPDGSYVITDGEGRAHIEISVVLEQR